MKQQSETALLARVGDVIVAVPLAHVRETLRCMPCERLPAVPPYVSGVSIIRGVPVPVMDAGKLLGQQTSSPRRLVLLRAEQRALALAVDEVLDVRALSTGGREDLPPLLGSAPEVAHLARLDSSLLVLLEASRLVPMEVWSALAGRDAR